ncbi:phosphoglycerate kinase [Actinomycetospora sp. TBRC 11914]|uniref:phosphoglycerate kinase n=1 Tax=Actinomycetospora sp. TBRC 11914 TaxID=2729387 RepID=UPI00145CB725|nr:phosphoglycerate kinase [Actinomycetospora sp. TBRC 11914]NMO89678.1 phosphoglycerate kinase [Actinomycetospora sp. TBRC 11914]
MKTVDDLLAEGVQDRFVLLRADFNVPLDGYTITDDGRIRAALPTITKLVGGGAKLLILAHLGRPKETEQFGRDPKATLSPVAARLGQLLDQRVSLAEDVVGQSAHSIAGALLPGGVGLLANVRCDARETGTPAERDALATELVDLVTGGDGPPAAFVSDGFGVVHREQASVVEIARKLPAYGGDLVARETEVLRRLTGDPARPYVVILGGSKVSDKLAVLTNLLPKVDTLLVGGAMCFTFLAAQGHDVGGSKLESDQVETCRDLLGKYADTLVLPTDVVVASEFSADAETRTVSVGEIPEGWMGLDVGPETVSLFASKLGDAATVFWNGPMGVFELAPFAAGTTGVAEAVADSPAFSVIGGGDSASAIRAAGLDEERFGHISTGGGASLEFLEGKELPGIAVLEEA